MKVALQHENFWTPMTGSWEESVDPYEVQLERFIALLPLQQPETRDDRTEHEPQPTNANVQYQF
jgi:hypothetical protein